MIGVVLIAVLAAAPPDAGQTFQDLQRSHIDGNVPEPAEFDKVLARDLRQYFSKDRNKKNVAVEYELLRRAPTQVGVSYPKFYLWVRLAGGKSPQDRGAVRVAAIEKNQFEVTDFVSEEAIRADPDRIYTVFPAALCPLIKTKANLPLRPEERRAMQDPVRSGKPQLLIRPRTPRLVGPDPVEPAPVLVLMKQRAELDGTEMTPDEYEKTLRILANNWRLLNPNGMFNGSVIVACEPEVDTTRLGEYLDRGRSAGYPNVSFLFVIAAAGEGASPANDQLTAANAQVVEPSGSTTRPAGVTLKLDKNDDCASLSKEMVAHRLQKTAVFLEVGRRPPKPASGPSR